MTHKKGFNIISHEGTLTKIKTIMRYIIVHLSETKQNQTKPEKRQRSNYALLLASTFNMAQPGMTWEENIGKGLSTLNWPVGIMGINALMKEGPAHCGQHHSLVRGILTIEEQGSHKQRSKWAPMHSFFSLCSKLNIIQRAVSSSCHFRWSTNLEFWAKPFLP